MARPLRITCIGGGPAGLYFAILAKQAFPDAELEVLERNRSDDTFGWGVVFSDETLANFQRADPESYAEIVRRFAYWDDIHTWIRGECVRSTGHGFCGMSRRELLRVFHRRCEALGVHLVFEREIASLAELGTVDLIVAADGINSLVRRELAERFRPAITWGRCRFCWLGASRRLEAFTFVFRENEHGLFQVHAYPFDDSTSTFIVECREEVWRAAGLDRASEEETVAYCEALFADHLAGARLLPNRSIWRSFPTVTCETWRADRVVLLGDSAHTAHFSIGSGTKLAMEDSIALAEALRERGGEDVPAVLEAYEGARRLDVLKLQKAARTSQEWFENSARWLGQHPLQFTFNLLTRSKRITYENLKKRDPELVRRVDAWFAEQAGMRVTSDDPAPPPMFAPLQVRGMRLANRVVVSPMCQYSAEHGTVGDWHLVHLGARAVGGAGLVFTEMTDVSPLGRITHGCAGMYAEEHAAAWKRIVDFVHANSAARIGIQLAHAGRKGSCSLPWEGDCPLRDGSAWETLAPSPLGFGPDWPAPREMDRDDMEAVRGQFVAAAERAERAGFDVLELHFAHGYLLSSFISPVSNERRDEYGGSLENRMRFPLEVFEAVRAVWPESKPMSVRISATDWLPGEAGLTGDDAVAVARMLEERGLDLIDVSSAGNTPASRPEYGRMYQVPFADRIRHATHLRVIAVGAILGADHVNTILAAGRADLCALARPHLVSPYLTLEASIRYGFAAHPWPSQYLPAKAKN